MKALLAVAGLMALTAAEALGAATIFEGAKPPAKVASAGSLSLMGRILATDESDGGFYCDVVTVNFRLRGSVPAGAFEKVVLWNEQEAIIGEGPVRADGTATVVIDQLQIEEGRTRVVTYAAKLANGAVSHAGSAFGFEVTSLAMNAECDLVLPLTGIDNTVGASVADETIRAVALPTPAVQVGFNHAQQYLGGFRLEVSGTNPLYVDDSVLTIEFPIGTPASAITNITVVNDLGEKMIGQTSSDWNSTNYQVVHLSFGSPLQISGTGTNYHVLGNLKNPVAGMRFRLSVNTGNLFVKRKDDAYRVLFPADNARIECAERIVVSDMGPQITIAHRPYGWHVRGLGELGTAYKLQRAPGLLGPWQDVASFTGSLPFTPVPTETMMFFRIVSP